VIFRAADFLKRVREHSHAATAALFGGGFGERNAVVALCDARVDRNNFFGDLHGYFFALREVGIELRFFHRTERFDLLSFGGERNFRGFQRGFRGPDFALSFFDGHHLFELAVFRGTGFGFGVHDFVLQCFVRFVGFYGRALIAVFSCAFAPLVYIELEFLAFGLRVRMLFFCRGEHGAGSAQHRVGVFDAFRKGIKFRSQRRDTLIEAL